MPALLLSHRLYVSTSVLNEELHPIFDAQTRSLCGRTDLGIVGDVVNLARSARTAIGVSTDITDFMMRAPLVGSLECPYRDFR